MIRTDLAFESARDFKGELQGVKTAVEEKDFFKIERVEITDENSAEKLQKPCGNYVTVALPSLSLLPDTDNTVAEAIAEELKRLLPKTQKTILVAGLGNNDITADSVGPRAVNKVLATRHIDNELINQLKLPSLCSVAVISPSVLGKTGIEAEEILSGLTSKLSLGAIIVIDALAAADKDRICTSVQISNSGINPGSGVGNRRKEISERTLGVPVLAVGVPTVNDFGNSLVVTHRDIDLCVTKASALLSNALNIALQPRLDLATIQGLI